MKVKTSITISKFILEEIDRMVSKTGNRSSFIEHAIVEYLQHHKKKQRDSKDLELINSNFEKLNEEAEDALSFQAGL